MTHALTPADAQALAAFFLEARRAKHADFRMEAAGDPPAGNPPAGDPPAGDPPAGDPPTETPEEKAARLEAENATLKANSRKWEDRAKANKTKADEFDKLQASSATDAEKLQAAIKRGDDAERELSRYRVAASTGLPADLAEMLTGADEDAMEEQAKKLLARIAPATPPKTKPIPDPTQGGGNGRDSKLSAADEGRAEAQRRAAARQTRKS